MSAVGISAVSDEFMQVLWREIIAKNPNTHAGRGGGYMVHPMWMRFGDVWQDVREQSCEFGWKNYNPVED